MLLSSLVTYSRLAMPSSPFDGTTPGRQICIAHQRMCAVRFFIVPMERPWRFRSLTSVTTCLRLSPVARRCPRSAPARRSAPCACRGSRRRAPPAGASVRSSGRAPQPPSGLPTSPSPANGRATSSPGRNAIAGARNPVKDRVRINSVSRRPLDAPCAGATPVAPLEVFSVGAGRESTAPGAASGGPGRRSG